MALDAEGRVVISTRETAMKVANLRRDPTVSLCVLADGFYGPWAQVDGHADLLVTSPRRWSRSSSTTGPCRASIPTGTTTEPRCERERRLVVRITIERAGPNRSG